jgi:glycosyltransferase involved in cell wall biosynthesis
MSSGKPIVATNVGGIPELIKNGWTGILVPPRNPRALADAISYLLLNPDEATKMGERARAVARNYSWDNVVDKILRVYEALASHRAVSPPITTILSPK